MLFRPCLIFVLLLLLVPLADSKGGRGGGGRGSSSSRSSSSGGSSVSSHGSSYSGSSFSGSSYAGSSYSGSSYSGSSYSGSGYRGSSYYGHSSSSGGDGSWFGVLSILGLLGALVLTCYLGGRFCLWCCFDSPCCSDHDTYPKQITRPINSPNIIV